MKLLLLTFLLTACQSSKETPLAPQENTVLSTNLLIDTWVDLDSDTLTFTLIVGDTLAFTLKEYFHRISGTITFQGHLKVTPQPDHTGLFRYDILPRTIPRLGQRPNQGRQQVRRWPYLYWYGRIYFYKGNPDQIHIFGERYHRT